MAKNPILSELYDIRSQILAKHGNDLTGYLRSELQRLKANGHPIARIKQRSLRCTGATKPGDLAVENSSVPPSDR